MCLFVYFFFFSSRRRHTRLQGDWSSDVCSSDLHHRRRAERHRCADPGRAHRSQAGRDARGHRRHLPRPCHGLPAHARPEVGDRHSVARVRAGRRGAGFRYRGAGPGWEGCTVSRTPQDAAVDDAAATAFFSQHGARATALPPVAIVIAAYNEEGVVGSVVDALPNTLCGLSTMPIVVSDGSKDGAVEEANAHGALVCDVPVNRGQGAALRLGYRLAREGGAQYIITTDADGQYNPAEMDAVLRPVVEGRADFVTGSRKLGSQETKDPVRRLGTWVFAVTISLLTGQRITDSSFGLRAMRAEVTGAIRLEQPQY